ncbi:MAG: hypothetical protein ABIO57_01140 [Candidatus Paceibacterota bacterium]
MKKNLSQLLLLIPMLIFSAGLTAAYTPPVATPPQDNTDAPLDVGTADQVKDGDLAVTTFEARGNAYLAKDTFFNGMVRGDTPADKDSTVTFGGSANNVSVAINGTAAILGHYQSDSLKTPSGNKEPLCANATGTFYLCGSTATPATTQSKVYVSLQYDPYGGRNIVAVLSEPVSSAVTAYVDASTGSAAPDALSMIKNYFTADAKLQGSCSLSSSPRSIGGLTIPKDQTISNSVITLPDGCDPAATYISISSYSPQSTLGGRPIEKR